jgi:hypothetical protein
MLVSPVHNYSHIAFMFLLGKFIFLKIIFLYNMYIKNNQVDWLITAFL